ncbi:hypothetical protein CGZ93_01855 [Enemella dayhoffiae]|uniref:Uncharacterized protein n=1 Tax=Enemella dayhoffiae TaxID=2016507 RepID=A0A255HCM0_9ACTN|nr:hypothetical protein [Enemella dayhoffiae]OYO25222.1 hypothetical protein CGZ93_01855 [Enemella dayhoffiae]
MHAHHRGQPHAERAECRLAEAQLRDAIRGRTLATVLLNRADGEGVRRDFVLPEPLAAPAQA